MHKSPWLLNFTLSTCTIVTLTKAYDSHCTGPEEMVADLFALLLLLVIAVIILSKEQ